MIHLIKLEFKKLKIKCYIKSAFIATLIIFAFLNFVIFISQVEGDLAFSMYDNVFKFITSIINCTFMIYGGVLLARTVIDEYKNKTIQVIFGYSISRKKLVLAKLWVVVAFVFSAIVLSNSLILIGLYIIQIIHPIVEQVLTVEMALNYITGIISKSIFISIMSLIPLYFGFKKKSVPTTIVSSIITALIISSNTNGFSLSSITIVPIIFALAGIIMTYFGIIKDIEKRDIEI